MLVDMKNLSSKAFSDSSTRNLVLVNVATIAFALFEGVSVLTVMWVYWLQSVVIGFFTFIKLLNKAGAPGSGFVAVSMALFFAFHYGFFHFIYAVFLNAFSSFAILGSPLQSTNAIFLAVTGLLFLLNHAYSFHVNRAADAKKDIAAIFSAPYKRIIPMHLTIIFGGMLAMAFGNTANAAILILFGLLKTAADVFMHVNKHA